MSAPEDWGHEDCTVCEQARSITDDGAVALNLLRKVIREGYCDTQDDGVPRLVVDGTTWDVTEDEAAAFRRWLSGVDA